MCPAMGPSRLENGKVGIAGRRQRTFEGYVVEPEDSIAPNLSPCSIAFARMANQPSRLNVVYIRCHCGSNCHLANDSAAGRNSSLRCEGYGVEFSVEIGNERHASRAYNAIKLNAKHSECLGNPIKPHVCIQQ